MSSFGIMNMLEQQRDNLSDLLNKKNESIENLELDMLERQSIIETIYPDFAWFEPSQQKECEQLVKDVIDEAIKHIKLKLGAK